MRKVLEAQSDGAKLFKHNLGLLEKIVREFDTKIARLIKELKSEVDFDEADDIVRARKLDDLIEDIADLITDLNELYPKGV